MLEVLARFFECSALGDCTGDIVGPRDPSSSSDHHIRRLTLSRDGSQVAFVSFDHSTRRASLTVVPFAGRAPSVLLKLGEKENATALAWTPDAQHLLLVKGPDLEKRELWVVPAGGGQPRKLEMPAERMQFLRVHPDGRRIAFVSGEFRGELWVMENFLPPVTIVASRPRP